MLPVASGLAKLSLNGQAQFSLTIADAGKTNSTNKLHDAMLVTPEPLQLMIQSGRCRIRALL